MTIIIGEVTGVAIQDNIKCHLRGALSFGEKCFPLTVRVAQDYRHIADIEITLCLTSDHKVVTQSLELFLESDHGALWSCTKPPKVARWVTIFSFQNTTLRACMHKVDQLLTALDKTLCITFRYHPATR